MMLDVLLLVQEEELQKKADGIIEDELQSKCHVMDYRIRTLFQVPRIWHWWIALH